MLKRKIVNSDREKYLFIGVVAAFLNFLASALFPFIILLIFSINSANTSSLAQITSVAIVIGIIISIFILLSFLQKPYSRIKLIFSIIIGILMGAHLVVWTQVGNSTINTQNISITIDNSILFLFLLFVPIIMLAREIYNFIFLGKDFRCKLVILETISNNQKEITKMQVSKYISRNQDIDLENKKYLLGNLFHLIKELEKGKHPLIKRVKNRYALTDRGNKLLDWNKDDRILTRKDKKELKKLNELDQFEKSIEEYEVWTEESLAKINRKKKVPYA